MISLQPHEPLQYFPNARKYLVSTRRKETSTTTTLTLRQIDDNPINFIPGQYLTVYFPDLSLIIGKQYSISSVPSGRTLSITVKAIGRFSNRLSSLIPGDLIMAAGPEGDFYPRTSRTIVMLGGGMGVMPFRSMILAASSEEGRRMILFYSSKRTTDMPFGEELYELSLSRPAFTVRRFVTQEHSSLPDIAYRRMRIDEILQAADGEPVEYLASGSLSFVREMKSALMTGGISPDYIRSEARA